MKYRKKPVVIDAYQCEEGMTIQTLEGDMTAEPGDWIITGVKGERYPCKPDIFAETYEPAAQQPQPEPSAEQSQPESQSTGFHLGYRAGKKYMTKNGFKADIRYIANGYLCGHINSAEGFSMFHWDLDGLVLAADPGFDLLAPDPAQQPGG